MGGVESTPQEVLQNFRGVSYLLRGVKPPEPRQIQPCCCFINEYDDDYALYSFKFLRV